MLARVHNCTKEHIALEKFTGKNKFSELYR
jgi:hypothetical protein